MSLKAFKRRRTPASKMSLMPELVGDGDDDEHRDKAKKRQRAPRNKSTKTSIEFDPEKRRQFLTGFRKRKEERRKKAREQIHRDAKEEIKKAR